MATMFSQHELATGVSRELVWLKPVPTSKERQPYWRYSDRYGRCWLEPAW